MFWFYFLYHNVSTSYVALPLYIVLSSIDNRWGSYTLASSSLNNWGYTIIPIMYILLSQTYIIIRLLTSINPISKISKITLIFPQISINHTAHNMRINFINVCILLLREFRLFRRSSSLLSSNKLGSYLNPGIFRE